MSAVETGPGTAAAEAGPPRRRRWKRVLLVTFVVVGALAVLTPVVLHWHSHHLLDQRIALYQARGEPIVPGDFIRTAVPDDSNAAEVLRRAGSRIYLTEAQALELLALPIVPRTDRDREAAGWLRADNIEPLMAMTDVLACQGVDWKLRYASPVMEMPHPAVQEAGTLGKLMLLDAAALAHGGNHQGAVRRLREMMALADALDAQSMLNPHIAANGVRVQAARTALALAPALDIAGEVAAPAAGDVGAHPPTRPAEREQVVGLIEWLVADRTEGVRQAWWGERMTALDAARGLLVERTAMQAVMRYGALHMLDRLDRTSAAALAPSWPAAQEVLPAPVTYGEGSEDNTYAANYHMLGRRFAPAYPGTVRMEFRTEATLRAAGVALALRLYASEHDGRWPATLDELVPAYLPAVPADPFRADRGPLGYHLNELGEPVVYSVGENGEDDGGNGALVMEVVRRTRTHHAPWNRYDAIFKLGTDSHAAARADGAG